VPSSPDGIGLYSKNSVVNHLHWNEVECGTIVAGATSGSPESEQLLNYFIG